MIITVAPAASVVPATTAATIDPAPTTEPEATAARIARSDATPEGGSPSSGLTGAVTVLARMALGEACGTSHTEYRTAHPTAAPSGHDHPLCSA